LYANGNIFNPTPEDLALLTACCVQVWDDQIGRQYPPAAGNSWTDWWIQSIEILHELNERFYTGSVSNPNGLMLCICGKELRYDHGWDFHCSLDCNQLNRGKEGLHG
jgi:hypothetical protein